MTTEQKPIQSGFNAKTAAAEILRGTDLSGKVAIVTGGYSGIGTETTRVLAAAGAMVIVPARSAEKARTNLHGVAGVELAALDLLDPVSIDRFAGDFMSSGRPLHMLINSAGVMAPPLARDTRGYESQFSANHLGHFRLTVRLWPALVRAQGARVVAVSSRGHRFSGVDFDDPNYERRAYDKWQAYGQSKTANALFALGLDRRGKDVGVRAFSVHPGSILTDLVRYLDDEDFRRFKITRKADGSVDLASQNEREFKTTSQGAATSVVRHQLTAQQSRWCLLRGLRHRGSRAGRRCWNDRRLSVGMRSRTRGAAVDAERKARRLQPGSIARRLADGASCSRRRATFVREITPDASLECR